MQNPHFLLDKHDKLVFHNNLDVFFSTYPYSHIGNMLLIDNTPKACLTVCVATLALGLRPKQGLAKVRAKSEA
jgi:hypothetical protein